VGAATGMLVKLLLSHLSAIGGHKSHRAWLEGMVNKAGKGHG